MLIAIKCSKQAYEREPEVLNLYIKEIRILTPNHEQEKKSLTKQ
jgi:hypothetical protein